MPSQKSETVNFTKDENIPQPSFTEQVNNANPAQSQKPKAEAVLRKGASRLFGNAVFAAQKNQSASRPKSASDKFEPFFPNKTFSCAEPVSKSETEKSHPSKDDVTSNRKQDLPDLPTVLNSKYTQGNRESEKREFEKPFSGWEETTQVGKSWDHIDIEPLQPTSNNMSVNLRNLQKEKEKTGQPVSDSIKSSASKTRRKLVTRGESHLTVSANLESQTSFQISLLRTCTSLL